MISRCLIAILLVSMAGASCAHAQDAAQQIVIGERSAMHSKVMDEERRYLVYLPPSYQTAEGAKRRYPVIYLLDGGAQFHATAGIVHHLSSYSSGVQRMPESLIVALPNVKRTRDMTPIHLTSGLYSEDSGGSARYLQFIEEELIPFIDARYRTTSERTLIGHSLAGLFTLNALVEKPGLFQHYIAVDPSMWWGDQWLVKRLQATPLRKLDSPVSVYIVLANSPIEEYSDRSLKQPHEEGIQRIHALLQQQDPNLRVGYRFLEEETHGSSTLPAIYYGLTFGHAGFKVDGSQ